MLSIGLMSGTSMDGIDAALLETDGEGQLFAKGKYNFPYASEMKILLKSAEYAIQHTKGNETQANAYFKEALFAYLSTQLDYSPPQSQKAILHLTEYVSKILKLPDITLNLDNVVHISTHFHAQVITDFLKKLKIPPQQIDCIGYHGQTIYHQPHFKKTIQIGDGLLLAKLTEITVIHNFRQQDVLLGGQGAPFAPLYHQALAKRDQLMPVAVINCGGISNISLILGAEIDEVIGFDTGPGNGLLDAFVKKITQGQFSMDLDGQFAKVGVVRYSILNQLLNHSIKKADYFDSPPPKSLDLQDIQWISSLDELSLADGCATLAAFTTECITRCIISLNLPSQQIPQLFIISGGGAFNPIILRELNFRLKKHFGSHIELKTAHEVGWDTQALEAQLMAYFAVRSLKQLPLSTPKTTGVPYPVSGGKINLPPIGPSASVKKILELRQM